MNEEIIFLGQAGFRLCLGGTVIFIDPYFSNSVAETEGIELSRMVDIPVPPELVRDANVLLITHNHQDHCDMQTVIPLLQASVSCTVYCPNAVRNALIEAGIAPTRINVINEDWTPITNDLQIKGIPAAHPEISRDRDGYLFQVGFLIRHKNRYIYHSGDTCVDQNIIDTLKGQVIDIALLPVNEKNFFRDRKNIIGNMSIREAFQFAEEIGVKTVIPMHWDMFEFNSVFKEEIELLYRLIAPKFDLVFAPRLQGSQ